MEVAQSFLMLSIPFPPAAHPGFLKDTGSSFSATTFSGEDVTAAQENPFPLVGPIEGCRGTWGVSVGCQGVPPPPCTVHCFVFGRAGLPWDEHPQGSLKGP